MTRYSRMHLSPEVAMRALETADLEEKGRIAEGIALIAVIDQRRDFSDAGYSCMRSYCMDRLHMSEDKALRRIQVARAALCFPDLFECLADGRLTVTTASVLAPHLRPEFAREQLAAAAFKSRHEIARMIAARSWARVATLAPPDAPLVAPGFGAEPGAEPGVTPPEQEASLSDLCPPPAEPSADASGPQRAPGARRGRVMPLPTGGYEVRMSITGPEHELLREAAALLGHAVPSGDPAEIYAKAMQHYLALLKKQRFGVKPGAAISARVPRGRGIPKQLRRFVWERDGGCCTFVGTGGHRCAETMRVEIDHIIPVAEGGLTTPDNLRVLCSTHNRREAERLLGKERVARARELAQRERARTRTAAKASKARAEARDPVRQKRYDDVYAGMRGLGFTVAEARKGAAMVDTMPDASDEAVFKSALIELTRAVAQRGERAARCSA